MKRSNLPLSLSNVTHVPRATNASGSVLFDPITSAQADEILSWLSHVYSSPAIEEPISKTYDPAAKTYGDIGYAQWVGDFQLYSLTQTDSCAHIHLLPRHVCSPLGRCRGFLLSKSLAAMPWRWGASPLTRYLCLLSQGSHAAMMYQVRTEIQDACHDVFFTSRSSHSATTTHKRTLTQSEHKRKSMALLTSKRRRPLL